MLILNFSHPITSDQCIQIDALTAIPVREICTIPVQMNQQELLEPQIAALVNAAPLSSEEWQTCSLLINPPGYAPAAFY